MKPAIAACSISEKRNNRTVSVSRLVSSDRHHAVLMQHVHEECLQTEAEANSHKQFLSGHGLL